MSRDIIVAGTQALKANVASSATSVTLRAANLGRKALMLFNDSSAILYISYGAETASSSSYTVQVAAGGYYEFLPYTGVVTGIWASANGNARITEVV